MNCWPLTQDWKLSSFFDCSHKIKRKFNAHSVDTATAAPSSTIGGSVRLPKLDVPTFDGNILSWRQFWEQFSVSIHDRRNISVAEKLVYLQQALKGGNAMSLIEGLSRSGEHYVEAVASLKSRYDRPRLIHQTHVRMLLDTPSLKDGSGRELRHTVQQHLRALKSMEYEPSGPFITSVLELKLDVDTMFEWQRHSQEHSDVPPYQDLLHFIDLRAQASETSTPVPLKKPARNDHPLNKKFGGKPITSFATTTKEQCATCKKEKHPLYFCQKFKSLSHDQMISTLKENNLCMNCLNSGHFVKQCKSMHRCRTCQKPHHTLLHVDPKTIRKSPQTLLRNWSLVPYSWLVVFSSVLLTDRLWKLGLY